MQEIVIESKTTSLTRLRNLLEEATAGSVVFRIDETSGDRSANAAALVAVVGGVASALTALITGLLNVRKEAKAGTITLEASDGTKIIFPAEADSARIEELVKQARSLSAHRIVLER